MFYGGGIPFFCTNTVQGGFNRISSSPSVEPSGKVGFVVHLKYSHLLLVLIVCRLSSYDIIGSIFFPFFLCEFLTLHAIGTVSSYA